MKNNNMSINQQTLIKLLRVFLLLVIVACKTQVTDPEIQISAALGNQMTLDENTFYGVRCNGGMGVCSIREINTVGRETGMTAVTSNPTNNVSFDVVINKNLAGESVLSKIQDEDFSENKTTSFFLGKDIFLDENAAKALKLKNNFRKVKKGCYNMEVNSNLIIISFNLSKN